MKNEEIKEKFEKLQEPVVIDSVNEIETLEKMKKEIEWSINYHSEKLAELVKQREAIDLGINKILI